MFRSLMYSMFLLIAGFAATVQAQVDTTAAATALGDGNAAIQAIGGLILVLAALVAVYKWVSRSAR